MKLCKIGLHAWSYKFTSTTNPNILGKCFEGNNRWCRDCDKTQEARKGHWCVYGHKGKSEIRWTDKEL